jgi:hypothetical protein
LFRARKKLPLARPEGLLVEQVEDETVIYDLETKEAHCLKPLAAVVFAKSDGQTTVERIAGLAQQKLGRTVTEANVLEAITQLEACGLFETSPILVRDGLSRRDVMRRFAYGGAAAAFTAPLITSIVAPVGAWAASGCPAGSACTSNSQCSSGHCCQNNPGKKCNIGCCVVGFNDCECGKVVTNKCSAVLAGNIQPPCVPCTSLCGNPGVNCSC